MTSTFSAPFSKQLKELGSCSFTKIFGTKLCVVTFEDVRYLIGVKIATFLGRETFNMYRSMKIKEVTIKRATAEQVEYLVKEGVVRAGTHSVTLIPYDQAVCFIADAWLRQLKASSSPYCIKKYNERGSTYLNEKPKLHRRKPFPWDVHRSVPKDMNHKSSGFFNNLPSMYSVDTFNAIQKSKTTSKNSKSRSKNKSTITAQQQQILQQQQQQLQLQQQQQQQLLQSQQFNNKNQYSYFNSSAANNYYSTYNTLQRNNSSLLNLLDATLNPNSSKNNISVTNSNLHESNNQPLSTSSVENKSLKIINSRNSSTIQAVRNSALPYLRPSEANVNNISKSVNTNSLYSPLNSAAFARFVNDNSSMPAISFPKFATNSTLDTVSTTNNKSATTSCKEVMQIPASMEPVGTVSDNTHDFDVQNPLLRANRTYCISQYSN